MKYFNEISAILVAIVFTSCPSYKDNWQHVYIKNNSSTELVFYKSYMDSEDTSLIDDSSRLEGSFARIKAYSTKEIRENKENLEYVVRNGSYRLFIFSKDSVDAIPWERIRKEYIVAKRVDFDTWEQLEAVDFTVTYP